MGDDLAEREQADSGDWCAHRHIGDHVGLARDEAVCVRDLWSTIDKGPPFARYFSAAPVGDSPVPVRRRFVASTGKYVESRVSVVVGASMVRMVLTSPVNGRPFDQRLGRAEPEASAATRDVMLPTTGDDGEAAPQQEPLGDVRGGSHWPGLEHAREDRGAAIDHVEEQAAVAPPWCRRVQDANVGGDPRDLRRLGCKREVIDDLVQRMQWVDREFGFADELLIRPDLAERPPALEWPRCEIQTSNPSIRRSFLPMGFRSAA